MDVSMAIGKCERGCPIVITGRIIHNFVAATISGESRHIDDEITIIDAVLALIEKCECHGRTGIGQIGFLGVGFSIDCLKHSKQGLRPSCSWTCCGSGERVGRWDRCRQICQPGISIFSRFLHNSSKEGFGGCIVGDSNCWDPLVTLV